MTQWDKCLGEQWSLFPLDSLQCYEAEQWEREDLFIPNSNSGRDCSQNVENVKIHASEGTYSGNNNK